jgi:hypothetical protein
MFKNEACNLQEWIEYHRLAGVEHFWMYNNGSTDNWEEVLDPYIKEGLVEVMYWPTPSPQTSWVMVQVGAFKDGIQRARGQARWVAVIDIDEFLLPIVDKNIPDCLKKRFSKASAVYVNWRNFGTSHLSLPKNEPFLFKLTSCSLRSHSNNAIGKSIVQPDKVRLENIWYPHHFPLQTGCFYVNGDNIPMEFLGIDLPTDGKQHEKFLRINHYALRDDDYFYNVRLRNADPSKKALLTEQYNSFSLTKDNQIIKYLKKNHSKGCKTIWHVNRNG